MLLSERKVVARCQKNEKFELFQVNIFPRNWYPGKLECMFFLPQQTFYPKFRKKFKNHKFLESICSSEKLLWKKCSSHYTTASFLVPRQNNFAQCPKIFTKLSFFQCKNCSLILILWTGGIKFWWPCWHSFIARSTFSAQNPDEQTSLLNFQVKFCARNVHFDT